jgi:class 3 adenylate cyclase
MGIASTRHCTVMFADLRGSMSLYLRLGNTEATTLVTQSLALLGQIVAHGGGSVVKMLGDGLMAVFDNSEQAVATTQNLHNSLERIVPVATGLLSATPSLTLKIALTWGEIVDVAGDCYGDAVNVASRVLDLTGDHETLATDSFVHSLPADQQQHFRSIDRLHLKGRAEPVAVLRLVGINFGNTESMHDLSASDQGAPDGIRLIHSHTERIFSSAHLPLILGRKPQATFCVGGTHVSRSHAKIDGHSGHFYLVDLSYNGTYVQFDHDAQVLSLRRSTCTLHGSGCIALGSPPQDAHATRIRFEILSFSDTKPPW